MFNRDYYLILENKIYSDNIISNLSKKLGDSKEVKDKLQIFGLFREQYPFNSIKDINNIKNKEELEKLFDTWKEFVSDGLSKIKDGPFEANKDAVNVYVNAYIENISKLKENAKPFSFKDYQKTLVNLCDENEWIDKQVNEQGSYKIDSKDWERMFDLYVMGKDGESVASSITSKKKAIDRFVAGLKLRKQESIQFPIDSWRSDNVFPEFGKKALSLGATNEEIQQAFDNTVVPADILAKKERYSGKELGNRFIGGMVKKLLDSGADITFKTKGTNAITMEGKDAMRGNGRKWTMGYKAEVEKNGKKYDLHFDAVTDEGGGPTKFVMSNSSSGIFHTNFQTEFSRYGSKEFQDEVLSALNK